VTYSNDFSLNTRHILRLTNIVSYSSRKSYAKLETERPETYAIVFLVLPSIVKQLVKQHVSRIILHRETKRNRALTAIYK